MITNIHVDDTDLIHIYDCIIELGYNSNLITSKTLRLIWNIIPQNLKLKAAQYGTSDTEVKDDIYLWAKKNKELIDKIFNLETELLEIDAKYSDFVINNGVSIDSNNGNDIKFYSREGNQFVSLEQMKITIKTIVNNFKLQIFNGSDFVLDGKMCVIDSNGKEDFKSAVSQIKRQSVQMKNAHYKLFDILTLSEFESAYSQTKLGDRITLLKSLFHNKHKSMSVLFQREVESEEQLMSELDKSVEDGWEGLMLREDRQYEGKRSRFMLKLKKFEDAEYPVKYIEYGPFRIIDKITGLEKEITTVTNIVILHKGQEVSVGSGFTLEQRQKYFKNPEILQNSIVSVKYFEETKDKNGKVSLRFPTIKMIYETGRNL